MKTEASYFNIANQQIREGKLQAGIFTYQKAIAQNPNFSWSHHNLGEALVKQGKFREAIAAYRRAIELNPTWAWSHHNLVEVLVIENQLDEAIASYRKAIELHPDLVYSYRSLGKLLVKTGKFKQAIVLFKRAIKLNPNSAETYYNLGTSLSQLGDLNEAVECYLKAIEIDPNFTKAYQYLRHTHAQLKPTELNRATRLYKRAIEAKNSCISIYNLTQALVSLADAYRIQNQLNAAIDCLQGAIYQKTLATSPAFVQKHWHQGEERKPDFLVIGAEKSGTSSLYLYLVQHPQVLQATQKEIYYFTHHFDLTLDWYLAHFPPIPKKSEGFLTGEATPHYLYNSNNAAQKIFDLFPDIKLITILRNPLERTISDYHQSVRLGQETRCLEKVISSEIEIMSKFKNPLEADQTYWSSQKGYLFRGLYIYFLEQWMALFSKEQFLIINSEEFFANPASQMKQVFDFLGLPDHSLSEYIQYNSGRYEPINDLARSQLTAFFEPHNQKLEKYLGCALNWQ